MMYPSADLLKDCQRLVKDLEKDIFAKAKDDPALHAQYDTEFNSKTVGITKNAWLSEQVTQAAVAWVLATVFVRFLEDNRLIDEAWISGPEDTDRSRSRLHAAILRREAYIAEHPDHSDVQYLRHVVREVGRLPACRDLFAEDRNPLFRLSVSAEGAERILSFWREQDRNGVVVRLLSTDKLADTRWLGDLYQDLSADARKRFALLQTPDFVEEFILDYTLTPAIQTFGLDGLRCIDPTCGSGHFLLGMFHRLCHAWERQQGPGVLVKESVRRAMGSIFGIDLNPFAVAISRFRLMIAGLAACGYTRMKDCPEFGFTLAVGNTLTIGTKGTAKGGFQNDFLADAEDDSAPDFLYPGEYQNAKKVLTQRYHVVVGNPPYIAVKDAAERERIKPRYVSCFKKWTLSVPFTERFFTLAQGAQDRAIKSDRPAGFVGLINSNNFTKREFGKALIEQVLPSLDLTHVIDTSGCYIPGHGTPTVILFGRNQHPSAQRPVRAVQGIRGEPGRPDDAAHGKVWTSMVEKLGKPGAETPWLSVADLDRKIFAQHPWSLGGGGASELKECIEKQQNTVSNFITEAGFFAISACDDVIIRKLNDFRRKRYNNEIIKPLISGDLIRDYTAQPNEAVFFPYPKYDAIIEISDYPNAHMDLWPYRTSLHDRPTFNGGTYKSEGLEWWRWHQVALHRAKIQLTITLAFKSNYNHFVLCRGGEVFKQTAPIYKMPCGASEIDHFALLGCLNSSTIAFYSRQICQTTGGPGGGKISSEAYTNFYELNASNVLKFPVSVNNKQDVIRITCLLDVLGQEFSTLQPNRLFSTHPPTSQLLEKTAARVTDIRSEMNFLQEELDWLIYHAYGIITEAECPLYVAGKIPLALGERAFEIDLARKVAAEEEETSWFERHRSTPITEIPVNWPTDYRQVVQRRLDLITSHPHIGLLEKPEHKRRWQSDPWDEVVQRGLRDWLYDHLEDHHLWPEATADQPAQFISTTALADRAFRDATFAQVAALYRGNDHFDQHALILELVSEEAVPALPALRYTDEGSIKRADWEKVWDLQRREDAGEQIEIPVPPRYTAKDFQKGTFWSHRGKLDLPKERFISYPGCQPDGDPGLLILWAGYDYSQHATALVAHYQWAKETAGWSHDRLLPLLVGLDQLVPWLKQWHNDIDPTHGVRLGDSYAEFLNGECHQLGKTVKDLREWKPTAASRATPPPRVATSDGGEAPKKRGRPRKQAPE